MGGFDTPLVRIIIFPIVAGYVVASPAINVYQKHVDQRYAAKDQVQSAQHRGVTETDIGELQSKSTRFKLWFQKSNPDAYALRAASYLLRGKFDKATHCAEKAIDKNDKEPIAFYVLGAIADKKMERQKAVQYFETCLKHAEEIKDADTDSFSVHWHEHSVSIPLRMVKTSLALSLYHNSQYKESAALLNELIDQAGTDSADSAVLFFNRGLCTNCMSPTSTDEEKEHTLEAMLPDFTKAFQCLQAKGTLDDQDKSMLQEISNNAISWASHPDRPELPAEAAASKLYQDALDLVYSKSTLMV